MTRPDLTRLDAAIRPLAVTAIVVAALALGACRQKAAPNAESTTAAPATALEQPPAPGPAREAVIPSAIEQRLANGLRVIVLPRAGAALVDAELLVLSGGEVDPPDRAGLADFTASLLTQGTTTQSAPQLAQAAEALGGSLKAQAGWNASRVGITVTTPKLAAALDLLGDVVRRPAFAKAEVERYRAQTLDALRVSLSDPADLTPLVAARLIHGDAPYGHPRSGTPASVAKIAAGDLRALHSRHYRPDNAVLILTGGLDADTGFALAGQVFGDWPTPKDPLPTPAAPESAADAAATAKTARVVVVDLPDAGQASVMAALPLPPRSAADYYAGLVTRNVLGGGYSSRLNSEIRIKRGLSYGAGAQFDVQRDGGALYASALTKNPSAVEVAGLIRSELQRLAAEPVGDAELAARKASYLGGYARGLETASGLAGLIARNVALGVAPDEIGKVIGHVNAITAAQVQAYAESHLKLDAMTLVVVGDAKQFVDGLKQAGFEPTVIAADDLDLGRVDLKRAAPSAKR